LSDIGDVQGQYVLIRASLNMPIVDGAVGNRFRLTRALSTINFLRTAGARVILVAHIGREPDESLAPVAEALQDYLPVTFVAAHQGEVVQNARSAMHDGDVLMLENLRQSPGEKVNDPAFANTLADLADVYVNDAFAASHRAHASIVGVPQHVPSYFGHNFVHEYDELLKAMSPQSPSLFILGGAKFATKIPLVERYLDTYDTVVVAGALANDIYKARGYEVGTSLVSDVDLHASAILNHPKLRVPNDVVVDGPNGRRTCAADAVQPDEAILDAGPGSIAELAPLVAAAQTILWNGPLGNYEAGFGAQTEALAQLVACAPGYAILGGGDTIAAIEHAAVQEQIAFMSTAGGAMLTFLESGTLPAIDAVCTSV
jgi:phosphoglycerate kinase